MFIAWTQIEVTEDARFAAVLYMMRENEVKNLGSVITPDFFAAVRTAEALQIYVDNLMRS